MSVQEAHKRLGDASTVFVDIRDVRELEREGMIPGAFHAPRGMLEFWVDPESPYYKPVFTEDKTYVLYCQSDWRGVLAAATLKEMGLPNVFHLAGGYSEWRKSGAPTGAKPEKKK
jgi:rhodanese-related sulfurtransferase